MMATDEGFKPATASERFDKSSDITMSYDLAPKSTDITPAAGTIFSKLFSPSQHFSGVFVMVFQRGLQSFQGVGVKLVDYLVSQHQ